MKTSKKKSLDFDIDSIDFDIDLDSSPKKKKTGKDATIEAIEEAKKQGNGKTFEQEAKEELTALQKENQLKEKNTRSDCWVALYFSSPEQLEEFLQKMKLHDILEYQYINGKEFAKRFGVEIESPKPKTPKPFRRPKNIDLDKDIFTL